MLGPRMRAAGLALPLVAFVTVTFIGPMASLVTKSVYDPDVADALPETMAALRAWDGQGTPPDEAFAAAAREFVAGRTERTLGRAAYRVNRVASGMRRRSWAVRAGWSRRLRQRRPPASSWTAPSGGR